MHSRVCWVCDLCVWILLVSTRPAIWYSHYLVFARIPNTKYHIFRYSHVFACIRTPKKTLFGLLGSLAWAWIHSWKSKLSIFSKVSQINCSIPLSYAFVFFVFLFFSAHPTVHLGDYELTGTKKMKRLHQCSRSERRRGPPSHKSAGRRTAELETIFWSRDSQLAHSSQIVVARRPHLHDSSFPIPVRPWSIFYKVPNKVDILKDFCQTIRKNTRVNHGWAKQCSLHIFVLS